MPHAMGYLRVFWPSGTVFAPLNSEVATIPLTLSMKSHNLPTRRMDDAPKRHWQ